MLEEEVEDMEDMEGGLPSRFVESFMVMWNTRVLTWELRRCVYVSRYQIGITLRATYLVRNGSVRVDIIFTIPSRRVMTALSPK
jgi:hypothetical protein